MNRGAVWHALRRCGWTAPAALGLLAAAAVLAFVVTPRWEADADAARAQAHELRAERAEAARRRQAAAPAAPASDAWPDAARSGDRTADLIEHALRSGVTVDRTQQRIDRIAGSDVQVLRLQQSVRGAYVDTRRLAAAALLSDPALGLERLRLQRSSSAAAAFDGELQWALLQRGGGATR